MCLHIIRLLRWILYDIAHYIFRVISILDDTGDINQKENYHYVHPTFLAAHLRKGRSWLVPRPRRCSAGREMLMPTFPGKCWWERKHTEDWYDYSLGEQMAVEACFYFVQRLPC